MEVLTRRGHHDARVHSRGRGLYAHGGRVARLYRSAPAGAAGSLNGPGRGNLTRASHRARCQAPGNLIAPLRPLAIKVGTGTPYGLPLLSLLTAGYATLRGGCFLRWDRSALVPR